SDACLNAARNCIPQITEHALKADARPDLMFGTAGAILGLAKLRKIAPYPELEEKIVEMAESLLERRQKTNSGALVVPTYNGRATTGLSHGVSGIALALARVYEATKEDRFRKAISEHVDFEKACMIRFVAF